MYEVFISFKNLDEKGSQTRDSKLAEELYLKLIDAGIEVFFSNREIERRGDPRWGKLIDRALQESKVLVVVGTKLTYIQSQWVEYEWRYFSEQIRNGADKQIVTLLDGLHPANLPPAFSGTQSYSPSVIDRLVDMIVKIVKGTTQESFAMPDAMNVSATGRKLSIATNHSGFFSGANKSFFLFFSVSIIFALLGFISLRLTRNDDGFYFPLFIFISVVMLIVSFFSLRNYTTYMPPIKQIVPSILLIIGSLLAVIFAAVYVIFDLVVRGYITKDDIYLYYYIFSIIISFLGLVFGIAAKKNYLTILSIITDVYLIIYAIMTAILPGFHTWGEFH